MGQVHVSADRKPEQPRRKRLILLRVGKGSSRKQGRPYGLMKWGAGIPMQSVNAHQEANAVRKIYTHKSRILARACDNDAGLGRLSG
jgi:hypothetical protein